MKKKILQVTNYYAPAYSFGGPTRLLEIYAEMLRKKGFRVDVLTTDMLTRETCQGHKVVDLGEEGKIEYVHDPRWAYLTRKNFHLNILLYMKIAAAIKRYDFVQLAEYRGLLPLIVLIFGGLHNVKIIHHSLGMISQKRGPKKRIYDRLFRRLFTKNVAICFAENEEEKRQYRNIGIDENRIIVLAHPIAINGLIQRIPKSPSKETLKLCFVGRIHPTKGVGNCIDLVHSLLPHFHDISLTVLGNDDGDLANVQRKIAELNLQKHVRFVEAAYDDTRFHLYRESDFFVILPEDNLQTSLAAIEALAAGTPVINNLNCQIDGWDEFVCTVDGRSDVAIADRIKKLLLVDKDHISAQVLKVHSFESVGETLSRAFGSNGYAPALGAS